MCLGRCYTVHKRLRKLRKNDFKQLSTFLVFTHASSDVNAFFQLQQLILAGELACKREEAATLAAIQMHVEEAWPDDNMDDTFSCDHFGGEGDHLLSGSIRLEQPWRPNERARKEFHTLHRSVKRH